MSDVDMEDVGEGTVSPFGSAKNGIAFGTVLGVAVALFEIVTNFETILQALGGILILAMIGAVVGLIGSVVFTIGYNLLVVAFGGGGKADSSST